MISKELDRAGVPVAVISAMYPVAEQVGASRIVKGLRIPHPCGDPSLPPELDAKVRQEIVRTALKALEAEVRTTTTFVPNRSTTA
ncbi:MAG: glycine/betaine/sarcosine/D-proline family reductase selenoprotein B [Deltaproteobacteria bacterium]|nr:glycine/betaine/sarcosine/D-proline family reductase selenoprotein B [Deltaproteobacteria bacterium]MBI2230224.1 glycine/betaine/sarcosine/D-proline family reductase selenoprotein B [Deltaproteobacteria bacterium]MBI2366978.1 glycine/betaine/sarcosine/D-proline family reductase selenoprotein B [Deltaproteobacteria bacterium]